MDLFRRIFTTIQFYLYGKLNCTAIGYKRSTKRNERLGNWIPGDLRLKDRVFIVTGANSGIGKSVSTFLASRQATVYLVCRNPHKGKTALDEIYRETRCQTLHLLLADVSLETGVRKVWKDFVAHRREQGNELILHGLVCNAGGLHHDFTLTRENVETIFATHLLFGTYLFIQLALPALESTVDSRVVVVSSGGMYTTGFPEWNVITCRKGTFNGQLAYAHAKRGQVLLCEKFSEMYPDVTFVSCHPGWVDTPGVDNAYGSHKKYLAPLRSVWEGSEGIAWLCTVPAGKLQSGAFYLDCQPRVKHLSGLFFTEGTFTKNTPSQVDEMLRQLQRWSDVETRPSWPVLGENSPLNQPLEPLQNDINLEKFIGRWYVWANIPTYFDRHTTNNIEDYILEEPGVIRIRFTYAKKGHVDTQEIMQRATVTNEQNTRWKLFVQFGMSIPVPMPYLVCYLDERYEHTIISVPNRSYVWIMARSKYIKHGKLASLYDIAEELGFDVGQMVTPPFLSGIREPDQLTPSD